MTTKPMPLFLMLLAALLVAAGYCLARMARLSALPGSGAGSPFDAQDFASDDPDTRRH